MLFVHKLSGVTHESAAIVLCMLPTFLEWLKKQITCKSSKLIIFQNSLTDESAQPSSIQLISPILEVVFDGIKACGKGVLSFSEIYVQFRADNIQTKTLESNG